MGVEASHIQITEINKETLPYINWMIEDLFCRYGVSMPYFLLDFEFPDYSARPDIVKPYEPQYPEIYKSEWAPMPFPDWQTKPWPEWVPSTWPDWLPITGYGFNMEGDYFLTWFNELLGLLFDTAGLPRWSMPDYSPESINMLNGQIGTLYESVIEEEVQYVYIADYTGNRVVKTLLDLTLVGSFATSDNPYSITADDDHIYVFSKDDYKLHKYLKSSPYTLIASSNALGGNNDRYDDLDYDDDYIYAAYNTFDAQGRSTGKLIAIINKSDLSIADSFTVFTGTSGYVDGIAVDDTHIYASDSGAKTLKKFNKTTHSLVTSATSEDSFDPAGLGRDSNYVYSVCGSSFSHFKLWNKSDLSVYKEISLDGLVRYAEDIAGDGDYAYIADRSSTGEKLVKIDLDTGDVVASYENIRPYGVAIK